MRGTLTIAWRDFRALVSTPLFFIISGICALVWSFMYIRVLDGFAKMSMQMAFQAQRGGGAPQQLSLHFEAFVKHISLVNFLLLMIVPALTMRLFAEEKKTRTYDLLLTSPVSSTQIAIGKFIAGYGAVLAILLVSFLYPLATTFLADIQWGPLISSYAGLALVAAAYVAIGMFASSLTESVMLAVIMGWIFNVGLWFIGAGADMSDNTVVRTFFEHLAIGEHFLSFLKGNVKTTAIVFFLSVVSLNCFLTQRVVESSRWR